MSFCFHGEYTRRTITSTWQTTRHIKETTPRISYLSSTQELQYESWSGGTYRRHCQCSKVWGRRTEYSRRRKGLDTYNSRKLSPPFTYALKVYYRSCFTTGTFSKERIRGTNLTKTLIPRKTNCPLVRALLVLIVPWVSTTWDLTDCADV